MQITVFPAKILTMNPMQPQASCVAVRDGRILAVGSEAEMGGWGPHVVDARFAGKVLMPGLVEGHSHLMEGAFWKYAYAGYHDRRGPDGPQQRGPSAQRGGTPRRLRTGGGHAVRIGDHSRVKETST